MTWVKRSRSVPRRSLWADRAAVSAVEFALVLPIMLSLLFGGFELGRMQAVSRKITLTTRAIATTGLKIIVSELAVDAAGIATVVWSQPLNATALPVGQVEPVPAAIAQPNSSLVWCTISYTYVPLVTKVFGTSKTLSDQIYMSPRLSNSIALTG